MELRDYQQHIIITYANASAKIVIVVRAKHYIDNKIIAIPAPKLSSQREEANSKREKHRETQKKKARGSQPILSLSNAKESNP
jgi:hypothetical protein